VALQIKTISLLLQGAVLFFIPKLKQAWLFRKEKATNFS